MHLSFPRPLPPPSLPSCPRVRSGLCGAIGQRAAMVSQVFALLTAVVDVVAFVFVLDGLVALWSPPTDADYNEAYEYVLFIDCILQFVSQLTLVWLCHHAKAAARASGGSVVSKVDWRELSQPRETTRPTREAAARADVLKKAPEADPPPYPASSSTDLPVYTASSSTDPPVYTASSSVAPAGQQPVQPSGFLTPSPSSQASVPFVPGVPVPSMGHRVDARGMPLFPLPPLTAVVDRPSNIVADLQRLTDLYQAGALTADQFEAAKAQVLR